jgi:hypothetical protein
MSDDTSRSPRGEDVANDGVQTDTCKAQHEGIKQWQNLHVKQDDERFDLLRQDAGKFTLEMQAVETRLGAKVEEQNDRIWKKVDGLCRKIDDKVLPKLALVDKTGAVSDMKHETRWTTIAKIIGLIVATGGVGGGVVFALIKVFGLQLLQTPPA